MVSALEHYAYCPRQCALIHVEQTFSENMYTLKGRFTHEIVDTEGAVIEGRERVERALPLWSLRLGLIGKADVVEFHDDIPYPVEYKQGPRRKHWHDDLQVCAQAMCLEEMTGKKVPRGAIYHHSSHRRREVIFDSRLREQVEATVFHIRQMQRSNTLPPPVADERCRECSLQDSCLPEIKDKQRLQRLVHDLFIPEGDT
ncbi:MAG: CRISPR-associated exonuclease Cas4 [Clostridia bacterium]|nr:CRISPR-associated exonuclease Cas4 [Clostridia bacterium]